MSRSINQNTRAHARHARSSAPQNAYGSALPNFRNLGILLRIVLSVNVVALLVVIVKSPALAALGAQLTQVAAVVEPLLILTLVVLYLLNGWLARLPYAAGVTAVMVLVLALTTALYAATRQVVPMDLSGI